MTDPVTSLSTLALAILSFVAVFISYWGIKRQTESLAKSVSADLCLKLVDRFDSSSMLGARGVAALGARGVAARALLAKTNLVSAEEVFDFFEIVGLYVRKNMLDKEVAHSMFFHWTNVYWHAGKNYISNCRGRSTSIYRDFEYLYNTVLAIEMKDAPKSRDINPTEADLEALLRQEIG